MVLHIGAPEDHLVLKVGVAHGVVLMAHGDKAGVEILEKIFLEAAVHAGTAQLQIFLKAGVMYGGGAVHDRVVMVEDQAFVSHIYLLYLRLPRAI